MTKMQQKTIFCLLFVALFLTDIALSTNSCHWTSLFPLWIRQKKSLHFFRRDWKLYIHTLLDWWSTLVRISFLSHNFQDLNNLKSKYAFFDDPAFNLQLKWDSKMKRTKNTALTDFFVHYWLKQPKGTIRVTEH